MPAYRAYPEYKDSGVEWLGEIPAHWEVTQIKYGFIITLGKMLSKEPKNDTYQLKPYLKAINIQSSGINISNVGKMWFSPIELIKLRLKKDDILISEGGDVGRSAIWKNELPECYIQNAVNMARAKNENNSYYLYFWMYFLKHSSYIDILCNKATIAHYTAEKVEASPLFLPTPKEQKQIADFLDHETAKIDTLISKQERLIELLKEKRQAVISHAVTKGLDANAPMKDSGVEWLGEVPAHWEVKKIKHIGKIKSGDAIVNNELKDSGKYEIFGGNGLMGYCDKFNVSNKSFIIGRVGAYCGNVRFNNQKRWISDNALIFSLFKYDSYNYIFHLLTASKLNSLNSSNAQPLITGNKVINFNIPYPSKEEQQQIADFLDHETTKMDTLVEKSEQAIKLLKERKTALISSAVTGKIDVRDWGNKGKNYEWNKFTRSRKAD